ncbi:DUF2490 domain-containing protein [Spirosoma sp. KNUC1025]|uniref:DUF2490 domain-containing protein n=1 Tax=Spirosoma sp. KNUC1025 TaxID=2894082 RepID=UPI00386527C9|nr:DUF2490 domain-containing protein [Spirosoma sp. KNUC1025]
MAQSPESYAIWLLSSAKYTTADSTIFGLQPGWNPQLAVGLLYVQSTVKATRWLDINLGYMFLSLPGQENNESTLLNGITLRFRVSKLLIDNQNLIWNRFRSIHDSYHFDRNRLRIFRELTGQRVKFSPYLYEETWFYFADKTMTRNRTGLGVLVTIKSRISCDLLYTKQWDRVDGNSTVFFNSIGRAAELRFTPVDCLNSARNQ